MVKLCNILIGTLHKQLQIVHSLAQRVHAKPFSPQSRQRQQEVISPILTLHQSHVGISPGLVL